MSDTLIIATPDDEVGNVWDCIKEMSINERIICHVSGSLSSDVFIGIEEKQAHGASVHPLLAFRDKYSSYEQLHNGFFTLEGDETALQSVRGKAFACLRGGRTGNICLVGKTAS